MLRLCGWGHVNIIKLLVVLGANAYAVDNDGCNTMMLACDREDMYMFVIQSVLSFPDISINQQNYMGDTALMVASRSQYHSYEKINSLLKHDAIDINIKNKKGETALMGGDIRSTKILLNHSTIEVNILDKEGNTALMRSVQGGHLSVVQVLVEHGAKLDIVNNSALTAMEMVETGCTSVSSTKITAI